MSHDKCILFLQVFPSKEVSKNNSVTIIKQQRHSHYIYSLTFFFLIVLISCMIHNLNYTPHLLKI